MALEKINDHIEQALARLPSQFREKENLENLIRGLMTGVQDVENILEQLLKARWVGTAFGAQLDGLGSIVGEPRLGRNDDEYRLAIKLRIAINTDKGTPEEFINIFKLITECTETHYFPAWPAAVEIYGNCDFTQTLDAGPDSFAFDGGPDGLGFGSVFDAVIGGPFATLVLNDMNFIFNLLQQTLPAGVLLLHVGWYNGNNAFAFGPWPTYLGFGDVNNPATGGEFATIII